MGPFVVGGCCLESWIVTRDSSLTSCRCDCRPASWLVIIDERVISWAGSCRLRARVFFHMVQHHQFVRSAAQCGQTSERLGWVTWAEPAWLHSDRWGERPSRSMICSDLPREARRFLMRRSSKPAQGGFSILVTASLPKG